MTKHLIVLTSALLLLNFNAFTQQQKHSLQEVWQQTLAYFPSLRAKTEWIEEQELKKDLTKKQFLPDVNVQAQQSFGSVQNIPGSFFPQQGMYTISGSNNPMADGSAGANVYTSAVLQWNFMQFGRKQAKIDVADAGIGLGNRLLKQEEWQLLSIVTRLYFAALNSHAAAVIARADTERVGELLSLLQSQTDAGLRPGADTLLLKSSLLQAKSKEHEQEATLKKLLVQLSAFTGATIDDIDLDTSFYFRLGNNNLTTVTSVQDHPYLQVLEARIEQVEAEKEVIRKEAYPSVGLLAGVGLKGSGIQADGSINKGVAAPWRQASGNYLVGLGLTWNFSSLYQNKTKRAIAEKQIAAAGAERETAAIQLAAQHAAAVAAWQEQKQKLAAAEASMQSSKEAYELYEVRYHSGLLSLIELLQLQKNLQDAETNYTAAVATYWNEMIIQAETLGDLTLLLQ